MAASPAYDAPLESPSFFIAASPSAPVHSLVLEMSLVSGSSAGVNKAAMVDLPVPFKPSSWALNPFMRSLSLSCRGTAFAIWVTISP
ncbi:hypothetical protein D9M70_501350 [compost metagenome]